MPFCNGKYYVNIPIFIKHFDVSKFGWYGIKLSDYSVRRHSIRVGSQSNPYVVEIMVSNDIKTYSVPLG
nr:MAG TPA: hypothetical protein [Caudoviricetes sp.]